ncbi:MAG TPA: hypothetical protein VMT24_01075 [Aggregatilineaceae bacterium]|jgi:hypothetical protein|nr:hypothetical protein [Aggregatilineaceae bacterium]
MASDNTNSKSTPNPLPSWGRPFAVVAAIVFLISSVFPVVAGLSKDTASFPPWWGTLDVGFAFVLAITVFVIVALGQGRVTKPIEDATYRAYRILIHGILALTVLFLFSGDRIVWINGLPGIAWRAWLLLYGLPAWLGVMGTASGKPK